MHTICPICYKEVDEDHDCLGEQWEEPIIEKKRRVKQPYKRGGSQRSRK